MTSKRVPSHLAETDKACEEIIAHAGTIRAVLELLDELATSREVTTRPEDRDRVTGGGQAGYANLDGDDRAKRLARDIRKDAAHMANRLGAHVAAWGKLTSGPNPEPGPRMIDDRELRRLEAAQVRRNSRVEEVQVDW
jgi:hypothetical protein